MTDPVEFFQAERSRLVALAYRMLGTPDDADDIVQEAWFRFSTTTDELDNPAGWLTTVVTRLSIDRLRSAQVRRELYVGPWLPEPIAFQAADDPGPDDAAIMAESLSIGVLAVMERLSPVERAVFLLHDVFGYSFGEVAVTVERTEAAARQIGKRARDHIQAARPRFAYDPKDVEALSDAFLGAVMNGDVETLGSMLAADVVHVSDGGADHHAARVPVVGRDRVTRLFTNLAKRIDPDSEIHKIRANGQFGYLVTNGAEPQLLVVSNWNEQQMTSSYAIRNPDKLATFHQSWLAAR